MEVKPLHDYVVVQAKEKQVSKVIAVANSNDSDTGTVIAVGPGEQLSNGTVGKMGIIPGQDVIFAKDILRKDKQEDGTVRYWMRIINVMGILSEK
jgi:co-chaperonin GroES (HSP10)